MNTDEMLIVVHAKKFTQLTTIFVQREQIEVEEIIEYAHGKAGLGEDSDAKLIFSLYSYENYDERYTYKVRTCN